MEFSRIIVDGDSLIYRCGFAAQGEDDSHACYNMKKQLADLKRILGTENMDIYIKGKGNFRDEVAVTRTYKGTRSKMVPTAYHALREYVKNVHGAKEVDGMEADDVCSIDLYRSRNIESGVILAAMDKDLWNTPGWHFNYHPDKRYVEYITPEKANRNFLIQLLEGDRSDNVPGLPTITTPIAAKYGVRQGRCGKMTAKRLANYCEDNSSLLRLVVECYDEYAKALEWSKEEGREYLLEQGQLLWMTRELNPDGSPVLWTLPEGY